MTTTDSIILVREAKTCSYVLIIHTPRLCGEPGFKSRLDSPEESSIRCREIVESIEQSADESPLTDTDRPLKKMSPRQPLLTVPSRPPADPSAGDGSSGKANQATSDRLRKVLEAVLSNKDSGNFIIEQINIGGDGEEMLFEFELDDVAVADEHPKDAGTHPSLLEALGAEVKGEKTDEKKKNEGKKTDQDQTQIRDEL